MTHSRRIRRVLSLLGFERMLVVDTTLLERKEPDNAAMSVGN